MPRGIPVGLIQMEEAFYESDEPPAWVGRNERAIRGIFQTMDVWRECGVGDCFHDSVDITRDDMRNVRDPTEEVKLCMELFVSWVYT